MTSTDGVAIAWFRRDLRLADHPALTAAAEAGSLVPLYVHDPEGDGDWAPGAASKVWLHHSLHALDAALRERGSRLVVRQGPRAEVLAELCAESGAWRVCANRVVEPAPRSADRAVQERLQSDGVRFQRFVGNELTDLDHPRTGSGDPYKVFTPYWRALSGEGLATETLDPPALPPLPDGVEPGSVDDLGLLPDRAWGERIMRDWRAGEAAALGRLGAFSQAVTDYADERDRPDHDGTSRLSPHLAFGEISPRRIAAVMLDRDDARRCEPFVRQLGWREFSRYQLFHVPRSADSAWNADWDDFPWAEDDAERLARWQSGTTGIAIVDAGMRQLWHTGWLHNRVRMIVASYLAKHLGQHWLHGACWFWDTLFDADLANNTMGWQWSAGTGADAAPYFRIFNPDTQAGKYDPAGDYIRHWLDHAPARPAAGPDARADADAAPVVGLKEGREAALERYRLHRERQ